MRNNGRSLILTFSFLNLPPNPHQRPIHSIHGILFWHTHSPDLLPQILDLFFAPAVQIAPLRCGLSNVSSLLKYFDVCTYLRINANIPVASFPRQAAVRHTGRYDNDVACAHVEFNTSFTFDAVDGPWTA